MKRFRLEDTEDHLSEVGVANGTRLVPAGTVLLLTRGMTLLNDLPICVIARPMTFNQDVKAVQPKPNVSKEYLPYLLLGNKDRLLALVDLAGHGTGRLNSDELNALDVTLPPIVEQQRIAQILSKLDDKIELNRRMAETLDAIARALFKSWFVDFDPVRAKKEGRDVGLPAALADVFPNTFEESELGEIPSGWEMGVLGSLGEQTLGGDWGADAAFPGAVEACCLRGVDLEHLRGDGRASVPRRWFKPISLERRKMDENEVVIAGSGAGPTGRALWMCGRLLGLLGPCTYSNFCKRIRCRTAASAVYLDAWLHSMRDSGEIWEYVNGTSVPNLDMASLLSGKLIPIPPESLLDAYYEFARRMWVRKYMGENDTLSSIRDALLPKLISGEMRLRDADRIVAEATSS